MFDQQHAWGHKQHFKATLAEFVRKSSLHSTGLAPSLPTQHYSDPTTCSLSLLSFVFNLKGGGELMQKPSDSLTSELSIDVGLDGDTRMPCPVRIYLVFISQIDPVCQILSFNLFSGCLPESFLACSNPQVPYL